MGSALLEEITNNSWGLVDMEQRDAFEQGSSRQQFLLLHRKVDLIFWLLEVILSRLMGEVKTWLFSCPRCH